MKGGLTMKDTNRIWLKCAAAFLWLATATVAMPAAMADDDNAPNGESQRAVRLSNVDGQVKLEQAGETLSDHAVANTPLFEGTLITTGSDGRAEVQFEDGSVARVPPDSTLLLSVLQPSDTELVLNSGMGYFELQGSDSAPMRVRFGSSVATVSGFTVFRVKLDEGPATVAVFSGNAHLESDRDSTDLHGGQTATVGSDSNQYDVADSIEPDSWDAWNSDRDQALTTAESAGTAATEEMPNRNNPAWGDLNSNGTWYNVPDQGYVWSPYEASNSGWDPYGTGYWVWTPRFGYVWVSGEPWGYMPYQCGMWNYYDAFGWGWAPGGCQTWWGGGVNVWAINVGNAPRWYRLPHQPGPVRPRNPNPLDSGGGIHRGRAVGPEPIIVVHRGGEGGFAPGRPLPPREKGTPVTIGGTQAEPLRPVWNRPRNHGSAMNQPQQGRAPVTNVPARPGYIRSQHPDESRDLNAPRTMPAPIAPRPGPVWQPSPNAGRSSPPPAASRPAPAPSRPAPAPSRPAPAAPSRPASPPASPHFR